MLDWITIPAAEATMYWQLLLALTLGMLLGLERSIVGKRAGMRTFALVAVASCLFTIISELVTAEYLDAAGVAPLRVAAAIVTGIGFLGTGIIIFDQELKGLTTAASLWVTAGIGMAVGFGFYALAIATALITLFVFEVLWHVEQFAARHVRMPKPTEPETVMEKLPRTRPR